MDAVGYFRVSTQRQGKSGLGLEAQRAAVQRFAADHGYTLAEEFTEVETGKGHDALERRPQLAAALAEAKRRKCPVIVSKLCRLGRDVHFISGLMANRVPFIVAELGPDVDAFMLHIYAAMSEKERLTIAQRTKDALAAAKAKGQTLGRARENREEAAAFAKEISPVVEELRGEGITTVRAVSDALNARGVATARGGRWHPTSTARLLQRLGV